VSVSVDISEAQLRGGIIKLALALVGLFVLVAVGLSLLVGRAQGVAVNVLLVCIAFTFLANGVFVVLKIIDWFENRKRQHG
jgi:hypothetical protein